MHAFDLRVARAIAERRPHPPQWVGLKYFNVYGPNEYHKRRHMISVVKVKHDEVVAGWVCPAVSSDRAGTGGRRAAGATSSGWATWRLSLLWLLDTPSVNGPFNLGTGQARSYLDLAHAVCDAAGMPRQGGIRRHAGSAAGAISVVHRGAGWPGCRRPATVARFTPLEEGVRRCAGLYLTQPDPYV